MKVRFKRPDGKETDGYLAMPEAGENTPGVVVVPEWWGVNEQIQGIADRLAEAGYRALVPDIFHGRLAKMGDAKAAALMLGDLDYKSAVEQDIRGAVRHLEERAPGTRAAIIGFCAGGALAIAAAVHVRELNAAVSFYGIPKPELADPRLVRIPFMGHYAQKDQSVTPERVGILENQLKEGGVNHEIHRYNADHAFFNEQRPEVHDETAAVAAWDRTLAFLQRTIGGTPM